MAGAETTSQTKPFMSGFLDPIKDFAKRNAPYLTTGAVASAVPIAASLFSDDSPMDRRGGGDSGAGWLWLLPLAAMAGHWAYDNVLPTFNKAKNIVDNLTPVANEVGSQYAAWHGKPMPEGANPARMQQLRQKMERLHKHKNSWFLHPVDYKEYKMRQEIFGDPQNIVKK